MWAAAPGGIVRGRVWVPPALGMYPSVTSGSAKVASSEAMRTSQQSGSSSPGTKTEAVHADDGVATVAEQQAPHVTVVARAAGGHDGRGRAELRDVGPCAERPPLAPEHDDADVRVIAACFQVGPQQVAHLQVDCVQPVGPIERDRRHAASIDIEKDEVAHCRELLEEFADLEREPIQMREFDFVALGREP